MPQAEMINFFDDVSVEFPEATFKAYNGLFRINGDIAGWYFPLSKATMLKSIPFPNVDLIIFDEFIIEVGIYRYLPNEVKTFLECYSTISRDRDIPVLFLSNAITMTNPYFIYFNVKFEEGQTTRLYKHISVELIRNQDYIDHVASTKFGELIAGTDYGKYHTQNEFLLDNENFIADLPSGTIYICTFIINHSKSVGFYRAPAEDLFFISPKVDPMCRQKYALSQDVHTINTSLAIRSNPYLRQLIECYCNGMLRFETIENKNLLLPILRRLI